MSAELRLSILTPERRLIEDASVESVTLPGSEGEIQILAGHAPMIGTLQTGVFSFELSGKGFEKGSAGDGSKSAIKESFKKGPVIGVISSGFFEVKDDSVSVIAETLELKSEISVERARQAQKLAEEELNAASLDEHHFKKYQLKLQRALIRQSLGQSHKQ